VAKSQDAVCCGRPQDPKLTGDFTVAPDFDLGRTGPPLSISLDFIANGMVEMIGGFASALVLAR
jgi:ATP-binding cassette subfamily B protein